MYISIKAEMDTRPMLYPLIACLRFYGSVCVISSNRILSRLIEDDISGGFRNIRVIIDEDGASDSIFEEYGIGAEDYDFIILDNVSVIDYDIFIMCVGSGNTDLFDDELIETLKEDNPNIWIVHFGSKEPAIIKDVKSKHSKKQSKEANDDNYRPEDKFKLEEEERDRKRQQAKVLKGVFPTFQDIELLEGEFKFAQVNSKMIDTIYSMIKNFINVDSIQFRKAVMTKDESSGNIKRNWLRKVGADNPSK